MTLRACVLVAVLASGAACLLWGADPPLTDLRSQAQKDFQAGNFRDAWELYRKLALDPRDDERLVGNDLKTGIDCLQRLAREDEVDAFREAVVGVHQKNWRLLQAAADSFIRGPRYGYLIAGQFFRGNHRGGGESVSSFERDRVRALQLMQQAMPLLKADPDHDAVGSFYLDLAQQFLDGRDGGEAWKLQALTDLSKLPDYEPGGTGSVGRVPVAGRRSERRSTPTATRFFIMCRRGMHRQSRTASAGAGRSRRRPSSLRAQESRRAGFRRLSPRQFGVQTLLSLARSFGGEDDDRAEANAPFAVHTLTDDETIARLATGVKRFKLPDEFNFLRIYHEIAASGNKCRRPNGLGDARHNLREPPAISAGRRAVARVHSPLRAGTNRESGRSGSTRSSATGAASSRRPRSRPTTGRTIGFRFRNGTRVELEAPRDPRRKAPRRREGLSQIEPRPVRLEPDQYRRISAIGSSRRTNRSISASGSPNGA